MIVCDTIAAIATASGHGGIGIVRISGPRASFVAEKTIGVLPSTRHALLADFLDEKGESIDKGIALFFKGPNSFTGEDVFELQGHGGPAVLQLLLVRCLELGARLAAPGEFSQRAFLNGKLDLAQAESISDLINATSAAAAKSAMRSLSGEFSSRVLHRVDELVHLRMLVEATLDFPDEEIDFIEAADVQGKLETIDTGLATLLSSARQGLLLRDGVHVVLIGQPNVGKSSLLNSLAGEDVAIVTEQAGTTRDLIRQHIQIEGVVFHIMDTAGLRETSDAVERLGIERTWAAVQKCDIAVLLADIRSGIDANDEAILQQLPTGIRTLRVFNKIDTVGELPRYVNRDGGRAVFISAKSGDGLDLLRQSLLELAGWQPSSEGTFIARQRHISALQSAREHLQIAKSKVDQIELMAEELRLAQEFLNKITGVFGADDLLGEIFSNFCIGK